MTDTQPLSLAVVGCGGIAGAYMDALSTLDVFNVVAVVDPDTSRRESAAARFNCTGHSSLESVTDKLDAALVLTPPVTHRDLAEELFTRGAHVLCEKPLAPSPVDAMAMIAAAERANLQLMMGSKFRYVEDLSKAKALLDSNIIGDLLLFENVFCSRVDMTDRWNSKREISGGGVLIDNGCHSVDVARFLLGPIARLQARFGKRVQPIDVEDTARMMFETEGGVMGTIDLSWSLHKEVTSYVRLYGSNGTIEVGWKTSRYKLSGDAEWTTFGSGYNKLAAFKNQLANFAGSIQGTETALITTEDALASVRVIDTAYHSASVAQWSDVA